MLELNNHGLCILQIPVPPKDKVENDFEVVTIRDCLPGNNAEIYSQLKSDLKNQFKVLLKRVHSEKLLISIL